MCSWVFLTRVIRGVDTDEGENRKGYLISPPLLLVSPSSRLTTWPSRHREIKEGCLLMRPHVAVVMRVKSFTVLSTAMARMNRAGGNGEPRFQFD